MPKLSEDELAAAVEGLEGWDVAEDQLVRELRFDSFKDAVAFVVRLSYEAEGANHHPDIDIRYNRVRVALSTHDEGGITEKDVALATTVQQLAPAPGR